MHYPKILKVDGAANRRRTQGRIKLYDGEHFPALAAKLTACGFTQGELGYCLGVSEVTIRNWLREHPEFAVAISEARESTVKFLVAQAMRSALGYEFTESTRTYKIIDGKRVQVGAQSWVRYQAPSESMLTFLLINLSKGQFKNTKFLETKSTSVSATLEVRGELEADEIRKLAGKLGSIADDRERILQDRDSGGVLGEDTENTGGEFAV